MKTELWGTFSVTAHLRKRPFVAEVLLYDRLMIPRQPTPEEEKLEPHEQEQGTGWPKAWEPQKLRRLLNILQKGDLAVELPWGKQARQDWSELYNGKDLAALGAQRTALVEATETEIDMAKLNMPEEAAQIATSGLISMYIANAVGNDVARCLVTLTRKPGVEIEPVIAYGSYKDFQQEQLRKPAEPKPPTDHSCPYALFGWEFFVPEDSDMSDDAVLDEAVRLAARKDFRETRQSFHGWLKKMYDGTHDQHDAREEMLKMLEDYRAFKRDSKIKTIVRYVAKAAPVLAQLAGLIDEKIGIGVGVAVGGAALFVEQLLPESKPDERIRPAALVYDARRFFGKK